MFDFLSHLKRQIAFSRATFGPGSRQKGVIDHIKKEFKEIEDSGYNDPNEWTDVAILGIDGLWRSLSVWMPGPATTDEIAEEVVRRIVAKQNRNELRTWPDWRTAPVDKAIEHDRSFD